jgi:hypothetical protein
MAESLAGAVQSGDLTALGAGRSPGDQLQGSQWMPTSHSAVSSQHSDPPSSDDLVTAGGR